MDCQSDELTAQRTSVRLRVESHGRRFAAALLRNDRRKAIAARRSRNSGESGSTRNAQQCHMRMVQQMFLTKTECRSLLFLPVHIFPPIAARRAVGKAASSIIYIDF